MDICPDKGWHLFFLTAQNIFNTHLAFDCFLFCGSYFPRWNPKNYIFTDSFYKPDKPCYLVSALWENRICIVNSFFDGVNATRGRGRDGGPPWNWSVVWFWISWWWQTTAPPLVQFCGVPQGIVPGSLIYFSSSSNDPV